MLHFGRVLQELGQDPRQSGVKLLLVGGEPAMGIDRTRERIQDLWGARLVEFYGCTEASPHVGGYSCPASQGADGSVHTHLMEDVQVWETIDPDTGKALPAGQRGLTVCTNLNSESSPQLRFLVGDFATFDRRPCACGRTHVRAVGCFPGRSADVINLRGIKLVPSQLEEAVRSLAGVGDEFEIVLATDGAGMEVMRLRIEHPAHADAVGIEAQLIETVRSRCEVRVGVEVLPPGTLPKTEFKAKRVKDRRVPQ